MRAKARWWSGTDDGEGLAGERKALVERYMTDAEEQLPPTAADDPSDREATAEPAKEAAVREEAERRAAQERAALAAAAARDLEAREREARAEAERQAADERTARAAAAARDLEAREREARAEAERQAADEQTARAAAAARESPEAATSELPIYAWVDRADRTNASSGEGEDWPWALLRSKEQARA